jgi:hypothetical protein
MKLTLLLIFLPLLLSAPRSLAQTPAPSQAKRTPPIQDNSFLLEEAYNQEDGVVQHINAFMRLRGGDWVYTFTQEWPVFKQKHQFSYTLVGQRAGRAPDGGTGFGDLALNYRYQLVGDGEAKVAIAPRFSVLLPTGDERKGLGAGGTGIQVNVPASIVLHNRVVTHWNAGATYHPAAKNGLGEEASLRGYNFGQSLIWQARPTFNFMFETVYNKSESVIGPGRREREHSLFLNPGLRWAHNFRSGLQIVPGIAVPLGVGPSRGDRAIFIYLSFEHPFQKEK